MGFNKLMVMMVAVFWFESLRVHCEERGFVTWANSYYQTWGNHALLLNRTSELHLSLDTHSGSGFESITIYGSGSFDMKIKAPDNNSTGVITSFYLTSRSSRHDELSFQLLGSNGPPYTLNTNMFLDYDYCSDRVRYPQEPPECRSYE